MSITAILSTATSGLLAAQTGVRTVSDNVANATTPGYVRKVVNQTSLVTHGVGSGVNVEGIGRVVDRYLQSASLAAGSTAGKAGVLAEMLDRAQSLFGDPSGASSFFDGLNQALSTFAALADDPASSLQRAQSLTDLRTFFDESSRISSSLVSIQHETDTRINSDLGRVNDLLSQIAQLNGDIRRAKIGGTDSSGSENIQSQLVDELSGLLNVQIVESSKGGVVVRTEDGMLLADEQAGAVDYHASSGAAGYMTVTPSNGGGQTFDGSFSGGEIVGLLETRNKEIPAALAQLAEFTGGVVREINRAHNASSTVPAPASLSGRDTGLDLPTAVGGFTGKTTIALVDSSGVLQHRVDIDFDAGGISLDGGASSAFTAATFLTTLNTALGANGTASFANGALTLTAASGGVAVQDDATSPSNKAGQGFSQFFGLNDLVKSATYPTDTGLTAADNHGFTAGQTVTFRLSTDDGDRLRDVTFTVPAGATMSNLLTALNATSTGVAPYGAFSLDANGRMTFASSTNPPARLSVVTDTTTRGAGGPSLSSFFGIGSGNLAAAASGYSVNPAIYQDPSKMALAHLDMTVAAGTPALAAGDGRGASALAAIGETLTSFGAAGNLPAATMTLSRYASEFAGSLGRNAAAADNAKTSAESVQSEADNRRSGYEGVNMDEELIRLTTYQQAFNASARLIQAASDLYDVLLKMV